MPVQLESPRAGERLPPQRIQTRGQIVALLLQNRQPGPVALRVPLRCILALGLLARVINLQRQNGKPVNHQPRCLGVQRRLGRRQSLPGQGLKQKNIHQLHKVIAPLVCRINPPLHTGNLRVRRARPARFVFNVP